MKIQDHLSQDWEMIRNRIFNRPWVGLTCLLVLSLLLGSAIVMQAERTRSSRDWIEHTNIVLMQITGLTQSIYAAESAQRGFIATGLMPQLEIYNRLMGRDGRIESELGNLRDLVKDNPVQVQHVTSIARALAAKKNYMDETIALAQRDSLTAAQERLRDGQGIRLMDDLLATIDLMNDEEHNLLASRTETDRRIERVTFSISALSTVMLLLVIVAAYLAIRSEFRRRRAVEEALRESDLLQRTILNNAFYPIIASDHTGRVTTFNPAAEKMLGYTADEVIGKVDPTLWHDKAEMRARAQELSVELGRPVADYSVFVTKAEIDGSEEREWNFVHKDGRRIDVMLCVTVLRDEDGAISGYMGVAKDITETKQVEKIKNEFISTVSHELRTPLTSIRGSLGLLAGNVAGEIPDKAAQMIHIAYKNTERLVKLINNILDIEKLEAGRMNFERKPVEIDGLLQQAQEVSSGLAAAHNIKITINNGVSDGHILGDQDRLQQVIGNLMSNAIKFSPEGSEVRLFSTRQNGRINLTVEDQGPGVPSYFQDKIFKRFAQADNVDPMQKSGSGLGLSISKTIVEELGGSIGFKSQPGNTSFYVSFPELESRDLDVPIVEGSRGKVLICEDDPDIAMLLRLNLEQEGYSCTVAGTAGEAKQQLAQQKFVAMTLDLCLPDQNGMALIHELRLEAETRSLPIIVISACLPAEKKLEGSAIEVADWLAKPIDLQRLNQVMANVTRSSSVARILHIEDDADIVEFLAASLEDVAHFTRAGSIDEAKMMMGQSSYDLALLDINLPDGNGLKLLPNFAAQHPPIPVIILSVSETAGEIKDKVVASLVKSVVSEDKIISTVKAYIERRQNG